MGFISLGHPFESLPSPIVKNCYTGSVLVVNRVHTFMLQYKRSKKYKSYNLR